LPNYFVQLRIAYATPFLEGVKYNSIINDF